MTFSISTLTPKQALSASGAIYGFRKGLSVQEAFRPSLVEELFDFSVLARTFSAQSGVFEFKQNAGFAVMAKGRQAFENQAILVCRGTAGTKDWLSDFNIGLQISLSGHIVHAGFNRIYNQFRDNLLKFIDAHHPAVVHCVGHSLGGALANLAVETLVDHGCDTRLYTFGSPRVGIQGFANKLSLHPRLGLKNIYRVYHSSDPVSMVPLFPFIHAPQPGGEYYIGKILTINPWDHKMEAYTRSIEDISSWTQIKNPHPALDALIDDWMKSDHTWRYCGLNIQNIGLAMKAIQILVKDTLTEVWNVAGGVTSGGVTVLDQLSLAVSKAGQLSKTNEGVILNVLNRILGMLGIRLDPTRSLTLAFIQFVFRSLNFALSRSLRIALS